MSTKVYLIINAGDRAGEKNVCKLKSFSEQSVESIINSKSGKEIYIDIKDGSIDDIINYAKERKFIVVNYGKTYILNKCFMGTKYTLFGNNISHEAINKFEADDGKRYFFLCDDGKISSEGDYITPSSNYKKFLIDNAVLVSFSEYETGKKKRYAFIQKAEKLSLVSSAEEESVTYGGIKIKNIFKTNKFSKDKGIEGRDNTAKEDDFPCITFSGKEILKPKDIGSHLFLYDDVNSGECSEQLSKQSMKQYVFEGSKLFDNITKILENGDWEYDTPYNFTDKFFEEESVLSIINKENKETYMSSLIAYVIEQSHEILKNICGVEGIGEYKVYREENNVDILVKSEKDIIIIENKINANITEGEQKRWDEFINGTKKNWKLIEEINDEFPCGEGRESQLQKYYNLALYYAKEQGLSKGNVHCYILCPEYKKKYYEKERNTYKAGKMYTPISYKKLYDEITDQSIKGLQEYKQEIIHDIKRSIKMYTFLQNDYYMNKICGRFVAMVIKLAQPQL